MPKKLNDKQILELVTEHANGASITGLARQYGLHRDTVRRYVEQSTDFRRRYDEIKTATVTEWLNSRRGQIQGLLDRILALLPGRIDDGSLRDLVGAYKILTETSVNNIESKREASEETATEISVEFEDASEGAKSDDDA